MMYESSTKVCSQVKELGNWEEKRKRRLLRSAGAFLTKTIQHSLKHIPFLFFIPYISVKWRGSIPFSTLQHWHHHGLIIQTLVIFAIENFLVRGRAWEYPREVPRSIVSTWHSRPGRQHAEAPENQESESNQSSPRPCERRVLTVARTLFFVVCYTFIPDQFEELEGFVVRLPFCYFTPYLTQYWQSYIKNTRNAWPFNKKAKTKFLSWTIQFLPPYHTF